MRPPLIDITRPLSREARGHLLQISKGIMPLHPHQATLYEITKPTGFVLRYLNGADSNLSFAAEAASQRAVGAKSNAIRSRQLLAMTE